VTVFFFRRRALSPDIIMPDYALFIVTIANNCSQGDGVDCSLLFWHQAAIHSKIDSWSLFLSGIHEDTAVVLLLVR